MLPTIDESQTPPVVISRPNLTSVEDEIPATEGPTLPPHCLTAHLSQSVLDQSDHPLDELLVVADKILASINTNVHDYTATMNSQVFVDDKLQPEKYLFCKIRHRQILADGAEIPFAAYTKFLKPQESAGQEAIWVEGQNDNKLIAHAAGLLNLKRVYLDPEGPLAMKGNRYPIGDIGFRNLIVKIVERGESDRHHPGCRVTLTRGVDINGRKCSLFEVSHAEKHSGADFHLARIYLDDDRNIPIAYEGYLWPENAGEDPPLLEKYYYSNVKLNVGLTDADFDPANEEYSYPGW